MNGDTKSVGPQRMSTAEPNQPADVLLARTVVELHNGLETLEVDIEKWARINTTHGRRQIASTLRALRALVQAQDILAPQLTTADKDES